MTQFFGHVSRLDIIFLKLIQIFSKQIFCNWYRYFQKIFHRYLASCWYSIGHLFRYFKICLPIYLPIF